MYVSCNFLALSCLLGSFVTFSDVLSMFILSKREKVNTNMRCNIVINQEPSLSASDRSAPKIKVKDRKRAEAARRGKENYMKNLRERFLKDNHKAQMILKEFIGYFQQDLKIT